jgi:hypothetical protein
MKIFSELSIIFLPLDLDSVSKSGSTTLIESKSISNLDKELYS